MKLRIPKDCVLTNETVLELKKLVKYLIKEYEIKYKDKYKVYLYANCLKIVCRKKSYYLTIVQYNHEYFWYVVPFLEQYLLMKCNGGNDYQFIMCLFLFI